MVRATTHQHVDKRTLSDMDRDDLPDPNRELSEDDDFYEQEDPDDSMPAPTRR